MKANIVTLPGDCIGPEIIAQAVKVLEAVAAKYGHEFYFDERKLGGASIARKKGCSPCAKACRCSPICALARFIRSFPARARYARTSLPSRLTS